jgi:hypothetical protein
LSQLTRAYLGYRFSKALTIDWLLHALHRSLVTVRSDEYHRHLAHFAKPPASIPSRHPAWTLGTETASLLLHQLSLLGRTPPDARSYGEQLDGCIVCNLWTEPGGKRLWRRLPDEDIEALRRLSRPA